MDLGDLSIRIRTKDISRCHQELDKLDNLGQQQFLEEMEDQDRDSLNNTSEVNNQAEVNNFNIKLEDSFHQDNSNSFSTE